MEAATALLLQGGEQEFMRITSTAMKIIQNVLCEPGEEKHRRVRAASKYVSKPGVAELLEAIGFELQGEHYVLSEGLAATVLERKEELVAARKNASSCILGWDVPSSSLRFSRVLGVGKYGDVFAGQLDGKEVMVKTLKPDGGEVAREAFDRELDLLTKLSHPNVLQLLAVTLTSDPTSLILEYVPSCMLDILHRGELSDADIVMYARQAACGMDYLHSQNVLHCDLAARNILVTSDGVVKICNFGLACRDGSIFCRVRPSQESLFSVRWTAPDVLSQFYLSKHSDVWSYGILLYEFVTAGSVPYASFSSSEVKAKVVDGYRLTQPQGCPDELYSLMVKCWAQRPTDRPHFPDVIKHHLDPLEARLKGNNAEVKITRSLSEEGSPADPKASQLKRKLSKVKELSYQAAMGKGGGLVRVYTSLISPFQHRVVVVCQKKSTVGDIVQTALAKCGKQELDPKKHSIALVTGPSSGSPARYLDPDDRILSVKAGAPIAAMFVLCVHMPGQALLDAIDSIRQNPAYRSAFDPRTRGYLVRHEEGVKGKKGLGKVKVGDWQRYWCVLDGSTLLCYLDEEDEGVKEYDSYLDFKGCSASPAMASKKSNILCVSTATGSHITFSATDKASMLQWIEAIEAASMLNASPQLLHASGGAVVQTGFVECQEFAYDMTGGGPFHLPHRNLGAHVDFAGTYSAVDYGKHWTVLKSSGLLQCLVEGRPETLFDLTECRRVKVHNPKEMKEGADYSIEVDAPNSRFVLHAETPTDHFDWVLAVEKTLNDHGLSKVLQGHRNRESGYVVLKRLLLMRQGSATELYSMPRCFDDMEDIYDPPKTPPLMQKLPKKESAGKRSGLLQPQSPQPAGNVIPLPPRDYLPPPLPPRDDSPPPLPPKGKTPPSSLSQGQLRPSSLVSNTSTSSIEPDEDYVLMQSPQVTSPINPRPLSVGNSSGGRSSSQPITIPNRRPSKRSILLRADSESSGYTGSSPPHLENSLSDLQEECEWVIPTHYPSRTRTPSTSSSHSLTRNPSSHSLSSHYNRQLSTTSLNYTPSHPPRNGERSSGYNSPLLDMSPSPGRLHRSHSNRINFASQRLDSDSQTTLVGEASRSDGMTVIEAHHFSRHHHHPISKANSVSRSFGSDGYCSSNEDADQLPPGWERGYCESTTKYFYFNARTGKSTWNIQEVFMPCQSSGRVLEARPGDGWQLVRMDDGRVYYFHSVTRQTTWDVQDTWA